MSQKRYQVLFDGEMITEISAANMEDLARWIAERQLQPCRNQDVHKRCPAEDGLHAHIPAKLFESRSVFRGNLEFFVADIPGLPAIAYNFTPERRVPPPVVFREK